MMAATVTMLRPPSQEEAALHERKFVYDELLRTIGRLEDLDRIPWLIKEMFRVEAWRERPSSLGRVMPASDLYRLVHDRPPEGLGTTFATIERLIADDVEALSLWTEATRGRQGQRNDLVNNVNEVERAPSRPMGNSREAALRRLNKEAASDERAAEARRAVLAGEMSPHAAAVSLGWRKRRSAYADLCAAWRRASEEERADLLDNVQKVSKPPAPTGNSREAALRRLNKAAAGDERAAEWLRHPTGPDPKQGSAPCPRLSTPLPHPAAP